MCGVGGHRAHLENLAREQRVLVSAVGVVGLGAVRGALVTLAVRFARFVVAIGGPCSPGVSRLFCLQVCAVAVTNAPFFSQVRKAVDDACMGGQQRAVND
jgi:hypothetical protein